MTDPRRHASGDTRSGASLLQPTRRRHPLAGQSELYPFDGVVANSCFTPSVAIGSRMQTCGFEPLPHSAKDSRALYPNVLPDSSDLRLIIYRCNILDAQCAQTLIQPQTAAIGRVKRGNVACPIVSVVTAGQLSSGCVLSRRSGTITTMLGAIAPTRPMLPVGESPRSDRLALAYAAAVRRCTCASLRPAVRRAPGASYVPANRFIVHL